MKRFIKKVIAFILIVVLCTSAIVSFDRFCIGPQYKCSYFAALIDKIERLERINEPKIILVGNSNVAFGMNSEMIEESIGMPVVNVGLHASLGNAFHEQIAKLNINSGDIVIVSNQTFSDEDKALDPLALWVTYDWNSSIKPAIRLKDYLQMAPAFPTYLKKCFMFWLQGNGNTIGEHDACYSRTAFNEYGDLIYKPEEMQIDTEDYFSKEDMKLPEINDICIERLNKLNEYCIERGATLLVSAYPIAYGKYSTYDEDFFIGFQNELSKKLDCDVISNYPDYFMPYEYFYDTGYHLTNEGAAARSSLLIKDIEKWMD